MISWDNFECFVAPAALCWIAGAVLSARQAIRSRAALWTTLAGTLIFAVFIAGLWTTLSRPPLRTMGETRLWYSFFLSISGLITYWRWRYRWVLPFTTLLALVFCMINILKPEIHDQSLMPALQSPWFIPHVTVYMFSYSVLGCAFILSCIGLYRHKPEYLDTLDPEYISRHRLYVPGISASNTLLTRNIIPHFSTRFLCSYGQCSCGIMKMISNLF